MVAADFDALVSEIEYRRRGARRLPHIFLVGIDGRGGSGKSTLARTLAERIDDATIVECDDFYLPSSQRPTGPRSGGDEAGGNFDWRRIREQVLQPLATGHFARFQRYDWDEDAMAEWHEVEPRGTVMIEGSYCTRPELADFYDLRIWVDAPYEVRLRRGLQRDGELARSRWVDEWMLEEDRYIATTRPLDRADFVVDGSATHLNGH